MRLESTRKDLQWLMVRTGFSCERVVSELARKARQSMKRQQRRSEPPPQLELFEEQETLETINPL